MPEVPVPLRNGFYESESVPVSSQMCKNLYVNVPDTQGITPEQLFVCPGLVQRADTGVNNVNRGAQVMGGISYFINGNELIRYNADDTFDVLGTIPGEGLVSTADNGLQLCIVVPGTGLGFIYSVAGGLVQITDPDFTANGFSTYVVFVQGYFLHTTASRAFFISALNDGLSYNAQDVGTAESDPDIIRSAHVHQDELYIFGSETIQKYRNVGGADFPFVPIIGAVIPKGISAPFSVTEFAGSFVWIGAGVNESPRVYMMEGNQAVEISTTSINFILQSVAEDISQVQVFNYTFRGAQWVGWSGNKGTFVYDQGASTKAGQRVWHERESVGLQLKSRWRGTKVVTAYDRLLTGDTEGGLIGEINGDVRTEYDLPIERIFSLPTVFDPTKPTTHHSMKLEIDAGQGNTFDPGEDPQMLLRYSDDGRVYKVKGFRSMGKVGQYNKKLKWSQLGYTERYRIYEFSTTAPVDLTVFAALLDYD